MSNNQQRSRRASCYCRASAPDAERRVERGERHLLNRVAGTCDCGPVGRRAGQLRLWMAAVGRPVYAVAQRRPASVPGR